MSSDETAKHVDAEYASNYERLAKEHWWWQARSAFVLDIIDSLPLGPDANLLDIGCGGGWSFASWEKYGQVHGVELDESLVARAGKYQSRIHCGPFDRTYRPGTRFSLILMLDVLEHLAEPDAALDYALELLEPGGKILITVPALPCVWTSHDDLNHHFVRYTRRTFKQLADRCGLAVDRLEYFFYWTTFVKLLFRIKEGLTSSEPRSPSIPSPTMNAFFRRACLTEQQVFARVKLPFGTSLVCVGSAAEQRDLEIMLVSSL